jgi:hypothetical protein
MLVQVRHSAHDRPGVPATEANAQDPETSRNGAGPDYSRHALHPDDLLALSRREIAAIHIKRYHPAEQCGLIVDRLMTSSLYGRYVYENKIGRWGQAFFESESDPDSRQRYEQMAVRWMGELRELCAPYLTPIDKLRLELDEAWPAGARIATLGGRKMFAGLPRHFGEGSEAEPHPDIFAWDAPGAPEAAALKGQWAWNVYLSVASKGGALVIWDLRLSRDEYERRRAPGSFGVRRDDLPDPIAVLYPEAGDMILFDSELLHAVEKIEGGSRVTWSCFVGYGTAEEPLLLWS